MSRSHFSSLWPEDTTLKNVIIEEIEIINNDKELCEKVCRSVGHRLKKCIELEGRQVEPYL